MPAPTLPPGRFAGWVELADGVPASGATVTVVGTPLKATCDKDGCFGLGGVPTGQHKVSVTHPLAAAPMYVRVGFISEQTTTNDGAAGTVQGTIAPPLFQLVGTPFPLSLAPGAKAQVGVKALNPGTAATVTAFLKLTWQPGQGSLDVKLTASWA